MSHSAQNRIDQLEAALPELEAPSTHEVTPEELERRQIQLARAREIRAAILAAGGPLALTSADLKHLARQEAEG